MTDAEILAKKVTLLPMNASHVDPAARTGRFTARLSFFEEPSIIEQLERRARDEATSTAAIVRTAVRQWLRENDDPERIR
jgi:hypothetical protein